MKELDEKVLKRSHTASVWIQLLESIDTLTADDVAKVIAETDMPIKLINGTNLSGYINFKTLSKEDAYELIKDLGNDSICFKNDGVYITTKEK